MTTQRVAPQAATEALVELRHSHEIGVDGKSHWVNHSHGVDPLRWLAHQHNFVNLRGVRSQYRNLRVAGIPTIRDITEVRHG